ncbi:hypothetical protein TELCIR_11160 [Teladorsagia circumcincta]|uniref:Serine carboxypeptidase S28 n=1 Tax=Teladorsagia circumcincta TaxID=45464 RepID=A0A2G9UA92_TELCI|nr:hypothetical protein TELCIR_11160 [Teladorsagia circumcincta]
MEGESNDVEKSIESPLPARTFRKINLQLNLTQTRTQKIDLQRYFYNLRYYRPGGNAIFLMVGGAGKQIMEWVQFEEAPFVQWGKERGAPLFALEHRFYGKSHPTE